MNRDARHHRDCEQILRLGGDVLNSRWGGRYHQRQHQVDAEDDAGVGFSVRRGGGTDGVTDL